MNRKLFAAGLSATVVLAVAVPAASATIIGGSSQSSQQGVNGYQGSNAATATGNVIVVGPEPAASPTVQLGVNVETSAQSVGTHSGTTGDVFISPTDVGPTQLSDQGVNAQQVSSNGAIGTQILVNLLGNSQIIGGDQDCLMPGAACAASTIIGTPTQANEQAVNYSQSGDGGVTDGDSYITPDVTFNALAGSTSQFEITALDNSQLIIG
jgi:hypothetical protein